MAKIPVWRSIRYAYSFTFGNLGTIIGLAWLPLVIFAIAGFFATTHYIDVMQGALAEQNAGQIGAAVLPMVGLAFVGMLCVAIVAVPVTRQALGLRTGGATVHFALGRAEWRVFGALISVAAVLFAIMLGLMLAVGPASMLLGLVTTASDRGIVLIVSRVIVLVVICAFVFIAVRLSFLFVPVSVVEGKNSLSRSWTLSQGNFWRILGIYAAVLIPLAIVGAILQAILLGMPHIPILNPAAVADSTADKMKMMMDSLAQSRANLPVLFGLSLVLAPFRAGLSLGAMAAGYNALTVPPADGGVTVMDVPVGQDVVPVSRAEPQPEAEPAPDVQPEPEQPEPQQPEPQKPEPQKKDPPGDMRDR